ncbi:hypothetical protein NH340_JMT06773 [Sarcoptes scabiei]|nr:hypothetical protein NH340_JMT06773 [Sarcoptes scabiei]
MVFDYLRKIIDEHIFCFFYYHRKYEENLSKNGSNDTPLPSPSSSSLSSLSLRSRSPSFSQPTRSFPSIRQQKQHQSISLDRSIRIPKGSVGKPFHAIKLSVTYCLIYFIGSSLYLCTDLIDSHPSLFLCALFCSENGRQFLMTLCALWSYIQMLTMTYGLSRRLENFEFVAVVLKHPSLTIANHQWRTEDLIRIERIQNAVGLMKIYTFILSSLGIATVILQIIFDRIWSKVSIYALIFWFIIDANWLLHICSSKRIDSNLNIER